MAVDGEFRHLGGGPKGVFLALRYVFVIAVGYLLIFARPGPVAPVRALAVAGALAWNIALSLVPARVLLAPAIAAPLLAADAAWVAWALRVSGTAAPDFFVLYFFVLLLAAVGEKPGMVVLGAVIASGVAILTSSKHVGWTPAVLLRIVVIFTAALFYGHVLGRIRSERQRGDRNAEWVRTLEAQVVERSAALHRLYKAARAASDAKSDFMASLSHEVRTPLHIIIGYSEMLIDGAASTPAEGATLGRRVRSAATGFLRLVDDLLEISRLESGRVHVDLHPLGVAQFVEELRQRGWLSPLSGVQVYWDSDPGPAIVETDATKLQVILTNLLTNALKYTRAGEIRVGVRALPTGQRVEFQIADTGPGMSETELARVRDPFHESRQGHDVSGIGLGLAIVYRYAALLGAEVSVQSEVGRGTSFVVAVPCRMTERAADASPDAAAAGGLERRPQLVVAE
jgi:signal transduction histidine kinase